MDVSVMSIRPMNVRMDQPFMLMEMVMGLRIFFSTTALRHHFPN